MGFTILGFRILDLRLLVLAREWEAVGEWGGRWGDDEADEPGEDGFVEVGQDAVVLGWRQIPFVARDDVDDVEAEVVTTGESESGGFACAAFGAGEGGAIAIDGDGAVVRVTCPAFTKPLSGGGVEGPGFGGVCSDDDGFKVLSFWFYIFHSDESLGVLRRNANPPAPHERGEQFARVDPVENEDFT